MWDWAQQWRDFLIGYIPPWLIKLVEKWLFGWFYLAFTAVSWIFGGGLWKWILSNAIYLIGAYYIGSIIFDFISHWIVQRIESAELSRNPAIKDLMMRARYPPYSRALYDKYKEWNVCQIIVGRHPILSFFKRCLNFFSAGAWDQVAQELFKSDVNHVLLLLVLRSPHTGEVKLVRLHKTEVVAISDEYTIWGNTTLQNVPSVRIAGLTLEQLLAAAHEENTKSFLNFRVLDNNCQRFTETLLEKNGLLTDDLRKFIVQDLTRMENKIPSYITPVSEFFIFISRMIIYILYIK
jgi:hypothetical protein